MFFRKEINPYPVSDKVTFRNVDKTLKLTVRADASSLVIGLKKANVEINRKVLADLAINDAAGFTKLVETAKSAVA